MRKRATKRLGLVSSIDNLGEDTLNQLRLTLQQHSGSVPVHLTLLAEGKFETVLALSDGLRVNPTEALIGDLERLLGRHSVQLQ